MGIGGDVVCGERNHHKESKNLSFSTWYLSRLCTIDLSISVLNFNSDCETETNESLLLIIIRRGEGGGGGREERGRG